MRYDTSFHAIASLTPVTVKVQGYFLDIGEPSQSPGSFLELMSTLFRVVFVPSRHASTLGKASPHEADSSMVGDRP